MLKMENSIDKTMQQGQDAAAELRKLKEENEKLKQLLLLASKEAINANCSTCFYVDNICNSCLFCFNSCNWKWRFADDVERLLKQHEF